MERISDEARRRVLARVLVASMAGLLSVAGAATATVPVVDLPHTVKTALGWIESHRQDLREIQQWQRQLDHYRQQLVSAARFFDQSAVMSDRFEARAADSGVAEACPGASGLSDLWSPLAVDPLGDVRQQQHRICQRIVLARNARYNEQVRMLRRLREHDGQLRTLSAARAEAGDSQGALAANDNDVARFFARAQTDLQYTQAALVAYDGYIGELERTQARLARSALGGRGSLVGGLVQGAALKAALEGARSRER